MERTKMIGILKCMGENNFNLRMIFIYLGGYIAMSGILYGNIIGILLCLVQKYFGIFKLPVESYYVSSVPISINIIYLLLVDIISIIVIYVALVLPSYVITKIKPAQVVKYE